METITTGMFAVTGSDFRAFSTAQPSIPGMSTSRVMTSGLASRARRTPSSPEVARITSNPASFSRPRCSSSRAVWSSSTTSTRVRGPGGASATAGSGEGLRAGEAGTPRLSLTRAGRRTVKTEPLPCSLVTAMSPPIIWQKRRLMTRPSPVPP